MRDKDCRGCFWYDRCDHEKRCEHYYSLANAEDLIVKEYKNCLEERAEDYEEVLKDFE